MSANPDLMYRFLDLARFVHGPCLLLQTSGHIVRTTRDFRRIADVEPGQELADHLDQSPEEIRAYLRRAARSVDPVPGAFRFRGREEPVRCRASRFGDRFGQALVFIHLPHALGLAQRFMALNRMMEELETETQRRRVAEQERLQIERRMQQAQKLESLGVLAGGIAHDFNNLLVGILANVDFCLEELPVEARGLRSPLTDVQRSAHQAADLCRQMLAYAGRGQFLLRDLEVGSVIREMVELLRVSVSAQCELNVELGEPLWVRVDPSQLRQVIMNLVINASEALQGEPGRVWIRASGIAAKDFGRDAVAILGEPQGPLVEIAVRDEGAGMNEKTLQRIFDPFFTTKASSRGLGLAAVAGVVKSHRGGLAVRSQQGEGSTFFVALPRIEPPEHDVRSSPEPEARHASVTGTVLVVDDDPLVRRVAARVLSHDGFQILEAVDGREALEVYDAHSELIVAILLDLTMPKLGGHAVLTELVRRHVKVPVVVSSGYSETELEMARTPGPLKWLAKPFTPSALRRAVRDVLQEGPGPEPSEGR